VVCPRGAQRPKIALQAARPHVAHYFALRSGFARVVLVQRTAVGWGCLLERISQRPTTRTRESRGSTPTAAPRADVCVGGVTGVEALTAGPAAADARGQRPHGGGPRPLQRQAVAVDGTPAGGEGEGDWAPLAWLVSRSTRNARAPSMHSLKLLQRTPYLPQRLPGSAGLALNAECHSSLNAPHEPWNARAPSTHLEA